MKKKIITFAAAIGMACFVGSFFFGCSNAAEADAGKQANASGTTTGDGGGTDVPQSGGNNLPEQGGGGTDVPPATNYVTLKQALEIIKNLQTGETATIHFAANSITNSDVSNSSAATSNRNALQQAILGCQGNVHLDLSATNITTLGNYAFQKCASLTGVTLPNTLTEIGIQVFEECTSLKDITIPASVKTIGKLVFRKTAITSLVIPDGVTKIGTSLVRQCASLESVVIPASVTEIEYMNKVFEDCPNLKEIKYLGTCEQWNKINISIYNVGNWKNLSVDGIYCKNGDGYTKYLFYRGQFASSIDYKLAI